jgi:hypothetical protein
LLQGRAQELKPIKLAVLLACPNSGSDYLRSLRRLGFVCRNPQAASLEVLNSEVSRTNATVLKNIVYAERDSDRECKIPFVVYAASRDNIVLSGSAQGAFPEASTLPGDHFSIIDPKTGGNFTVPRVKQHMLLYVGKGMVNAEPEPPVLVTMEPTRGQFVGEEPIDIGGRRTQVHLVEGDGIAELAPDNLLVDFKPVRVETSEIIRHRREQILDRSYFGSGA